MATYTFSPVPAWGSVGEFARIGTRKSATFPCTLPGGGDATVVQDGTTKVGYVESDANGLIPGFTTTDIPSVVIDLGIGQLTVHSLEAISAGAASAAAAAASATAAAGSASDASDAQAAAEAARDDAVAAGLGMTVQATGVAGTDVVNLNSALSSAATFGIPLHLRGDFALNATITVPTGTRLFMEAATITSTVTSADLFDVTGDDVTIEGGQITGPSSWDGTNSEWTYAVIRCTGANPTVRGVTLTNVRRVGIGFKNATGVCRAIDNTIVGNYPSGSWTEVETGHMGIGFDPGVGSRLIARGNDISSCVQGVLLGNFGTGSSVGSIVSGNHFEGCHNHTIYGSAGVTDCVVTNNTAVDCSRPVAMTGRGHDVSHNTFTTTLSSGNLSEACGIDMRDPVDCTVSFNTMKGSLHASAAAIQLARSGSNTTVTGNRVVGNRIEVTGTNTGYAIRVGTATETTMYGNIVADNDVKAPGLANQGVIAFAGANGSQAYGNKCVNNRVTMTGNSNGIYVGEQRGLDVNGNTIRLEYSSGSAIVLGGVFVTANSVGTKVRHNDFEVPSTFGTNITFRAYYEATSGVSASRVGPNRYSLDTTLLTGAATHIIQATSSSVLNEVGMTGAPSTVCGPGSTWTRADGGASTTFYVKESAASSGTWAAK